jgi:hypothetical protein
VKGDCDGSVVIGYFDGSVVIGEEEGTDEGWEEGFCVG